MSDRAFLNTDPASPKCSVVLPQSVPLPSYHRWLEAEEALKEERDAKWARTLSDFEAAKLKAESEGQEPPKAPVRPAPKTQDGDLRVPTPSPAQDSDLLRLESLLGEDIEEIFEQSGEITCQVKKEALLKALQACWEDGHLRYEMLADATATHYPAADGFKFSVVYHLTSISRRKRLRLRILIPEGFEPPSATLVYPSANWMEREIFDMFGIRFINHPDMTRILLSDDWEGHPLRKDYPVAGWGERDVDFREDPSGRRHREALDTSGQMGINLKRFEAI